MRPQCIQILLRPMLSLFEKPQQGLLKPWAPKITPRVHTTSHARHATHDTNTGLGNRCDPIEYDSEPIGGLRNSLTEAEPGPKRADKSPAEPPTLDPRLQPFHDAKEDVKKNDVLCFHATPLNLMYLSGLTREPRPNTTTWAQTKQRTTRWNSRSESRIRIWETKGLGRHFV